MIKVLHVTPQMDYGGVASVLLNYYKALNHQEVTFDYVTHGNVEDYHRQMITEGSRFYYFKTIGQIGFLGYIKQIKNTINILDYDIIHIHVGDLTGVYALAFKLCGAKKIINHGHGSEPVTNKRKYFSAILRYLAKHEADICIGCGVKAGDFMFGRNNYSLISNGIYYPRFETIDKQIAQEMISRFHLENRFVLTNIGNLQIVKNQKFLIHIIKNLVVEMPNVFLIIAGEGNERAELESMVVEYNLQDNVCIPGSIKDIPELLAISDVFLLSSFHEGIPVSALEAQTVGLPCILSDRIDHDVDIGNSQTYFLSIDFGTDAWVRLIKDLSEKQTKWIKDSDIHDRLKEHGFDVNENAKRLMSIYNSLLESS